MNHIKQIDIVKKQNNDLLQKVEELQKMLDNIETEDKKSREEVRLLIHDLAIIKDKWISAIDDLEKKKTEYSNLIFALEEIKGIMEDMNFKIPLYKKIQYKIRSKFK